MDHNRKQIILDLLSNPIFGLDIPCEKNLQLYDQALTHSSYANEMKQIGIQCEDYEKLEFLGNYILNCVLACKIYSIFPSRANDLRSRYPKDNDEALLSKQIDYLKSDEFISELVSAKIQEFDKAILIAKKVAIEESIRASSMEALIGAIYLNLKYDLTSQIIIRIYSDKNLNEAEPISDWYMEVQKIVASFSREKEVDKLIHVSEKKVGSDNNPAHFVEISVPYIRGLEKLCGKGQARDKRKAKQKAAENAIRNYNR